MRGAAREERASVPDQDTSRGVDNVEEVEQQG